MGTRRKVSWWQVAVGKDRRAGSCASISRRDRRASANIGAMLRGRSWGYGARDGTASFLVPEMLPHEGDHYDGIVSGRPLHDKSSAPIDSSMRLGYLGRAERGMTG